MGKARVGVYICHCGGNISDYVDVKKVAETIKSEDAEVIVSKDLMFDCSDASQNEMIEDVKTQKLDRIVVAACSPKLHELTFRGTAKRAGLNPYMMYHANIREQSSWAHGDNKAGATAKAIGHARAAVAYVKLAEPLERIKTESTQNVLIVGGGIAGLRAAIDLSGMNVGVILVEKSPYLGGHVAQLAEVYPYGRKGAEIARRLVGELLQRENVAIFTNAEVESYSGYVGKFEAKIRIHPTRVKADCPKFEEAIRACPVEVPDEFDYGLTTRKAIYRTQGVSTNKLPVIDAKTCTKCGECAKICGNAIDLDQQSELVTVKVGSIIVTTGFDPYEPKIGEYGYKQVKGVITLQQLERLKELSVGDELEYQGRKVKDIAFIYCVGSRQKKKEDADSGQPTNEYCSRYCCNATMNISLSLSNKFKDLTTYHLYRDIRTYGRNELMYESAGKNGSIFIRFDEDNLPVVTERDGKCIVNTKGLLIENQPIEIATDLVVLVTGMTPRDNKQLNEMLALPIGSDKFYKEVHQKLRPVETNIAGLLIAGTAQGPKDMKETLSSASAASSKAASFALKKELELEPFVVQVTPSTCNLSQECIKECPYGAIEIREQEGLGKKAWVNIAKCKGCGSCVAVCPTESIQLKGFTNTEVRAMIEALVK